MPDETKRPNSTTPPATDQNTVEPEEFLRAVLHISKEDAAEVREQADEKADRDR